MFYSLAKNQTRKTKQGTRPRNVSDLNRLCAWVNREVAAIFDINDDENLSETSSAKLNFRTKEICRGKTNCHGQYQLNLVTDDHGIKSDSLMDTILSLGFGKRAKRFIEEYYNFATSKFDTIAEWDERTEYRSKQ